MISKEHSPLSSTHRLPLTEIGVGMALKPGPWLRLVYVHLGYLVVMFARNTT